MEYKNILVNALVNLGDVVLTTSAIALLREAYPKARITMLVKPVVREAVENHPLIDEVLTFSYTARKRSFSEMFAMLRCIRQKKFDLSISLDRKLRPALLAFLAGIPTRVGPDRVFDDVPSHVPLLYTKVIGIGHDLTHTLQAETYQAIVRGVTGQTHKREPVFSTIAPSDEREADALLRQLPRAKRRIALCVRGTFGLKTWPKEYFAETVAGLKARHDVAFFVVGAPNDRDYADEVIAALPVPALNFCGKTSLRSLAALLARVDLFVSVDTGAGHIAATTGVPMVVMFGCTHPDRWHPINSNARVCTSNADCCPCHYGETGCPTWPKPKCLWNVKPSDVLAACDALLAPSQEP